MYLYRAYTHNWETAFLLYTLQTIYDLTRRRNGFGCCLFAYLTQENVKFSTLLKRFPAL